MTEYSPVRAAAQVDSPFDITEQHSAADLQDRRFSIELAFRTNEMGHRSNLTYLEEAYYFVPVHLALQLQQGGQYVSALDWFRTVYDYSAPVGDRKIYYGLAHEGGDEAYQRAEDWLLDPLNPHAIASTRSNSYIRFTLMSLVRCLLEFADAEYTRDTSESVPRARTLYTTALELLELPEFKGEVAPENLIHDSNRSRPDSQVAPTLAAVLEAKSGVLARAHAALLARPDLAETTARVGAVAGTSFLQSVARVPNGSARTPNGKRPTVAPTRQTKATQTGKTDATEDLADTAPEGLEIAAPLEDLRGVNQLALMLIRILAWAFCIPPNPMFQAFRLRAALNLHKMRSDRNIAGMQRQLSRRR